MADHVPLSLVRSLHRSSLDNVLGDCANILRTWVTHELIKTHFPTFTSDPTEDDWDHLLYKTKKWLPKSANQPSPLPDKWDWSALYNIIFQACACDTKSHPCRVIQKYKSDEDLKKEAFHILITDPGHLLFNFPCPVAKTKEEQDNLDTSLEEALSRDKWLKGEMTKGIRAPLQSSKGSQFTIAMCGYILKDARNKLSHQEETPEYSRRILSIARLLLQAALKPITESMDPIVGEDICNNIREKVSMLEKILKELSSPSPKGFKNVLASLYPLPPFFEGLPDKNPFFCGRESQLESILQSFSRNDKYTVVIHGDAGVGKSSTAVQFANTHASILDVDVIWISAGNSEDDFMRELKRLAASLQVDDKLTGMSQVQALLDCLSQGQRSWLLIVDNCDYAPLSRYLTKIIEHTNKSMHGYVMMTTRLTLKQLKLDTISTEFVKLYPFEEDEAVTFLLLRSRVSGDDRIPAAELASELGNLPLALDQAGGYVAENPGLSIRDYLSMYLSVRTKLLSSSQYEAKPPSSSTEATRLAVRSTWEIGLKGMQKDALVGQLIATVINILCCFPCENIPRSLIGALGSLGDELPERIDPPKTKILQAQLQKYHLFTLNSDCESYRIHRLLQDVIVDRMKERRTYLTNLRRSLCVLHETIVQVLKGHNQISIEDILDNVLAWSVPVTCCEPLLARLDAAVKEHMGSDYVRRLVFSKQTIHIAYHAAIYASHIGRENRAIDFQRLMIHSIFGASHYGIDVDVARFTARRVPLPLSTKYDLMEALASAQKHKKIQAQPHLENIENLSLREISDLISLYPERLGCLQVEELGSPNDRVLSSLYQARASLHLSGDADYRSSFLDLLHAQYLLGSSSVHIAHHQDEDTSTLFNQTRTVLHQLAKIQSRTYVESSMWNLWEEILSIKWNGGLFLDRRIPTNVLHGPLCLLTYDAMERNGRDKFHLVLYQLIYIFSLYAKKIKLVVLHKSNMPLFLDFEYRVGIPIGIIGDSSHNESLRKVELYHVVPLHIVAQNVELVTLNTPNIFDCGIFHGCTITVNHQLHQPALSLARGVVSQCTIKDRGLQMQTNQGDLCVSHCKFLKCNVGIQIIGGNMLAQHCLIQESLMQGIQLHDSGIRDNTPGTVTVSRSKIIRSGLEGVLISIRKHDGLGDDISFVQPAAKSVKESKLVLSDCEIAMNQSMGVSAQLGGTVEIRNCSICYNNYWGIGCKLGSSLTTSQGTTIYRNLNGGIVLGYYIGPGVRLRNTRIFEHRGSGICTSGANMLNSLNSYLLRMLEEYNKIDPEILSLQLPPDFKNCTVVETDNNMENSFASTRHNSESICPCCGDCSGTHMNGILLKCPQSSALESMINLSHTFDEIFSVSVDISNKTEGGVSLIPAYTLLKDGKVITPPSNDNKPQVGEPIIVKATHVRNPNRMRELRSAFPQYNNQFLIRVHNDTRHIDAWVESHDLATFVKTCGMLCVTEYLDTKIYLHAILESANKLRIWLLEPAPKQTTW